jgi:CheY-like chemotaxis protein
MILVVDDHEDMRYVLVRTLALDGYQAVAVSSGFEALIYLRTHKPALIVLDYNMPDMDGLMFFAEVRKDHRLRDVPVIMFTADDGPVRETAINLGVDAYVIKGSMDWAELRREIARLAGPGISPKAVPPISPPQSKDVG